jgi:hypothetical protein
VAFAGRPAFEVECGIDDREVGQGLWKVA